jgi:DNA-directed RNA polymerase specialized sigma24 family protein
MNLEKFYKQNFNKLVDRLTCIIGDRHEAEDRVQNIFVDLLNREYKAEHPLRYFQRAVTHQGYLYFRSPPPQTFNPLMQDAEESVSVLDYREKPADYGILQREELDQLIPVLIEQPVDDLVIVIAKLYWGYTGEEIAEVLGVPYTTCYSKYSRCIKRIRKALG